MNNSTYLKEFKELVNEYGLEKIGRLLRKTERGMAYWTAQPKPKIPAPSTQRKIHELFEKHRNGHKLFEAENEQENGLRDDLILTLREQIALLKEKTGINSAELNQKLEGIMTMQIAIMETLLVLAEENGKKGAYTKTVAILKKRKLEGIFL